MRMLCCDAWNPYILTTTKLILVFVYVVTETSLLVVTLRNCDASRDFCQAAPPGSTTSRRTTQFATQRLNRLSLISRHPRDVKGYSTDSPAWLWHLASIRGDQPYFRPVEIFRVHGVSNQLHLDHSSSSVGTEGSGVRNNFGTNLEDRDSAAFLSAFMRDACIRQILTHISDAPGLDKLLAKRSPGTSEQGGLLDSGGEPLSAYIGVDLTGASLHAGHLLPLMLLRRLWMMHNVRPLLLLGTATTRLALQARRRGATSTYDSGTNLARNTFSALEGSDLEQSLNTDSWQRFDDEINANKLVIKQQLDRIFKPFHDCGCSTIPQFVDNQMWLDSLPCMTYLMELAPHLSLTRLLSRSSVKEVGISEKGDSNLKPAQKGTDTMLTASDIGYTILQAADFYVLSRVRNCRIQVGGKDQWGNIATGLHVARRLRRRGGVATSETNLHSDIQSPKPCTQHSSTTHLSVGIDATKHSGSELYGLTTNLLGMNCRSDGKKMSKSDQKSGVLWLRKDWTPVTSFWQYWRNVPDERTIPLLRTLSCKSLDELIEVEQSIAPHDINAVKEQLADEMTAIVHGTEELRIVRTIIRHVLPPRHPRNIAESAPPRTPSSQSKVPTGRADEPCTNEIPRDFFDVNGVGPHLTRVLQHLRLCASVNEARRLITEGCVRVNYIKASDPGIRIAYSDFVSSMSKATEDRPSVNTSIEENQKVVQPTGTMIVTVGKRRMAAVKLSPPGTVNTDI